MHLHHPTMPPPPALLTPSHRLAAAALLAAALRQTQFNQSLPNFPVENPVASNPATNPDPWIAESRGLLRPIFRFLEIDESVWRELEGVNEDRVDDYMMMIFSEDVEEHVERSEQKLALRKTIDAMVMSWGTGSNEPIDDRFNAVNVSNEVSSKICEDLEAKEFKRLWRVDESLNHRIGGVCDKKFNVRDTADNNQQKVAVLFELLSACVADAPEDGSGGDEHRKGYDARHRVALRLLTTWLDVKWIQMEAVEIVVACSAIAAAKEQAQTQECEFEKSNWSEWKRGGIIGAAALTGGTLLAITGGLAAPAIAAGVSALSPTLGTLIPVIGASGFSAVASAAGSVAGSAAVAASFGAAGAGLSGFKMARRIGSIEEFEFKPVGENHNQGRLAVGILVSGFVFDEEDFTRPWEGWEDNLERYALQWESEHLIAVSTAIQDWITSRLTLELMKRGAMMTVLSSLVSAFAWPAALLSATDFIDSKWSIAIDRSDKAGKLLAEALLNGLQGNRPVTLLGFSLGARVIFKCLEHLAESGDNEGLVERVVLLGAPVSLEGEPWDAARKMVAGRFVNVFSANDWILGVTFRASLLTQGLAGIQAVNVPGVENVDVTDLIEGHSSYLLAIRQILSQLELDGPCPVFTCYVPGPEETKTDVS